jgi:uncharacterized protein
MKWLILLLIRLYWKRPKKYRTGCCHFKETCSHYVYRITNESGFIAGVNAFMHRFKQCRSGYAVLKIDSIDYVLFKDNSLIERIKTNI